MILGTGSAHDRDALHRTILPVLAEAVILFDQKSRYLGSSPAADARLGYFADAAGSAAVASLWEQGRVSEACRLQAHHA